MWNHLRKEKKKETPSEEDEAPTSPPRATSKTNGKDIFLRPTGAVADAAELEYVMALLHCQPDTASTPAITATTTDASRTESEALGGDESKRALPPPSASPPRDAGIAVSPYEVQALLLSRYGVEVSLDKIKHYVFQHGFAVGGDNTTNALSLVACLLIPQLWRSRVQEQSDANADFNIEDKEALDGSATEKEIDLVSFVLPRLLQDCTANGGNRGNSTPPLLTKNLLRRLLQTVDLEHVILPSGDDDSLLDEMIQAATPSHAQSHSGGENPQVLDVATFRRGLSGDLQWWDPYAHSHISPFETSRQTSGKMSDTSAEGDSKQNTTNVLSKTDASYLHETTQIVELGWEQIPMGRTIDLVAGTFYSRSMVVLLYASFLSTYVAYFFRSDFADEFLEPTCPAYEVRGTWATNRASFFCTVAWAICRFLYIIIGMGIYGIVYIGGAGLGNMEPRQENAVYLWSATIISGVFAVVPFLLLFDTVEGAENLFIGILALVFGLVVFIWNVKQLALFLCSTNVHDRSSVQPVRASTSSMWFPLFSNMVVAESWNMQAAYHKVRHMTQNSVQLAKNTMPSGSLFTSHAGRSMYSFIAESENPPVQLVGGFAWTWRLIQSGEMFFKEGIWFSTRLVVSNVLQVFVVAFLLILGLVLTDYAKEQFDEFPAIEDTVTSLFNTVAGGGLSRELTSVINRQVTSFVANDAVMGDSCQFTNLLPSCNDVAELVDCILSNGTDPLCTLVDYNRTTSFEEWNFDVQNQLLSLSGLNVDQIASLSLSALEAFVDDSISSLYPEELYMVTIPLLVATIAAVLNAARLLLEVLPATTATIMKYRCGVLPSLRSPAFAEIKTSKKPYYFLGQMFWGSVLSSLLMAAIFGGIAFFVVWQVTRSAAQKLIALILGVLAIVGLNGLISGLTLGKFGQAYYRRKPRLYNLFFLILETTYFAISFAFMVSRASQILVSGLVYSGRTYRPILSQEAHDFATMNLDSSHEIYLASILQHEAHRHPYLDLLALVYSVKVLHPTQFATRAGCAWRLLLAAHLFPWLQHREPQYEPLGMTDSDHTDGAKPEEDTDVRPGSSSRRSTKNLSMADTHALRRSSITAGTKGLIVSDLLQENKRLQKLLEEAGVSY